MTDKSSTKKNEDCLTCRLISGFGVMGMGFYIYAHSSNRGNIQTSVMRLLAVSAIGLGVARLLNFPFLKSDKKINKIKDFE